MLANIDFACKYSVLIFPDFMLAMNKSGGKNAHKIFQSELAMGMVSTGLEYR